jgi:hypothetical protein
MLFPCIRKLWPVKSTKSERTLTTRLKKSLYVLILYPHIGRLRETLSERTRGAQFRRDNSPSELNGLEFVAPDLHRLFKWRAEGT